MKKSININGKKQFVNLEMNLIDDSRTYNKEVSYKMFETKGGVTTAKRLKAKQHVTIEVFTINNVDYNIERHVTYKTNNKGGLITGYYSVYNNEIFKSDKKIIEYILSK
jgi:hypothetical protein